jgi:hypothetical protein
MRIPDDTAQPGARRWVRFRQDLGVLLWCSFLAACVATLLFFAYFDPVLLAADDSPPRWLTDRRSGYAIGFFFFWTICTVASFLTAYLIDTRADADGDAT